jgi:large subunit ribosomal protein L18e
LSMQARISALKSLRRVYRETGRPIWRAVRKLLENTSRSRLPKVNVGKIDKLASEGDLVIVPGKVLGGGVVTKRIIVGALSFSKSARDKIVEAGGEALKIEDFVAKYHDAKVVKLIGG